MVNAAPDHGPEELASKETWKELFEAVKAKGQKRLELNVAGLGKVLICPDEDDSQRDNPQWVRTWVVYVDVPKDSPLASSFLGLGPYQKVNNDGFAWNLAGPSKLPQKVLEDIIATIQMN